MFRSTVHPHAASRFVRLDVVAIDLRQLDLHWVVGSKDDEKGKLRSVMAAGLVPEPLQAATVLVFNGGFQPRHGRYGIVSGGVTLQPPKPDGCVVGIFRSDQGTSVWLGPWSRHPDRVFDVVRQTPPCLVADGQVHPALLAGNARRWAGQDPTRRTRRRSAVGIDASGQVLYYALGTEAEPVDLARGLVAVGAGVALELDINWNWTRCLLPGPDDEGAIRVRDVLVPGMPFGKNEYFARPSERDFFFVTRRP
jgi:hypothetical protein